MLKIGDKVQMTEEYYKKLLKSPRIITKYKKTREVGVIIKIENGKCSIEKDGGNWSLEYLELIKEENEI